MTKSTKGGKSKQLPARSTVTFEGMEIFVGLDVAKRNWKATIRTKDVVLRSASVPSEPEALLKILRREFSGARFQLAYEAGCFGFWIHDALEEAGIEVLVVAPHLLPSDLVKTDRLDSAKLARLLAGGLLRGIWVPSVEDREDRAIVRRRDQLLRARRRLQNQIKKLLLFHGVSVPEESPRGTWSLRYVSALQQLDFSSELFTRTFHEMVDDYLDLKRRVRAQDKLIAELAKTDRYAERLALLKTVPGVGILTGMVILVELQDFARFGSAEKLTSYLGLNPQQFSTGDHERMGHITRAGNKFVRTSLVELAWRAIRRDPALLEKYERIRARRGSKIAIVGIARRLALRIRCVLLEKRPYCLGVAA